MTTIATPRHRSALVFFLCYHTVLSILLLFVFSGHAVLALLQPTIRIGAPELSFKTTTALLMTEPTTSQALGRGDPSAPNSRSSDAGDAMMTDGGGSGMRLMGGLREIVDQYDIFLLDMWGVMHDGFVAYEGVREAVQKLKQAGKTMIILSNSSQRKDKSVANLQNLGFDPTNDFAQIITSGEVTFWLISSSISEEMVEDNDIAMEDLDGLNGCQPWDVLTQIKRDNAKAGSNNKVFVLGGGADRDIPYVKSCGWELASIEQADLILASGTFSVNDGIQETNKRNEPEAYQAGLEVALKRGAARGIPMIVSNPDKIRPDFERPPMPGTLGDMYEQALRDTGGISATAAESLVKRIGKPFQDVFDIALRDATDLSRACMVGDAIETDITGGSSVGIDTIWVLEDGVYQPEFKDALANGKDLKETAMEILSDFNQNKEETYAKGKPDQLPTVALPHFKW